MCTLTSVQHPATTLSNKVIQRLMKIPMNITEKKLDEVLLRGFNNLQQTAKLDYTPRVIANVNIGPHGVGLGHDEFVGDSMQIYQQALMYVITTDKRYLSKYVQIQDAWNKDCMSFNGANAPLECAWGGTCMIRAMELLKHNASNILSDDFEGRFKDFCMRIIVPNLQNRYNEIKKWKNNWILSLQEALLQWAFYINDLTLANKIIQEYMTSVCECVTHESGMCTETKRDLIHSQFQVGSMVQVCEMSWNQGIDLYKHNGNCVLKCMEYHASIINGKIPSNVTNDELQQVWFMPCAWEIGFNHYVNRKRLLMPETQKLLSKSKNRPERLTFNWGPAWTHYNVY
jgi:hypothetical protein